MKKGQGALEYLMTYGWALLIIVVVGAALYALGVLNPGSYTKSTCSGFTYFGFQDQALFEDDYKLVLLNSNVEVSIQNIAIDGTALGIDAPLSNIAESVKFTIDATNDPTDKNTGDTFSYSVRITYNTGDITSKTDTATCTGKVQ